MTKDKKSIFLQKKGEIERSKLKGYKVEHEKYLGEDALRIVCKNLQVNFLIKGYALCNLYSIWRKSGLASYISFESWLLSDEIAENTCHE